MYIAFDIGGTKMRIAVSKDCKSIVGEPVVEKTPEDFEKGIQLFSDIARSLTKDVHIKAAAGGIAGPLDREKKMLTSAPNIASDWAGRPLAEALSKELQAPVYLENDTAIVGLGEAHAGAGMGHNIVVYVTVSTGVGGVRIVNGKVDVSCMGFEPGHQIIDIDNTLCKNCVSGQLEDMVSGTATERRFGMKPYEVKEERVWNEELPKWLSYGLYNTILHWSPDVAVLGGSMIVGNPAISVPRTADYLREVTTIFPNIPEIKKAECGDFGGIHGAFALIRQNLK